MTVRRAGEGGWRRRQTVKTAGVKPHLLTCVYFKVFVNSLRSVSPNFSNKTTSVAMN
jgi:hypothetical protein